MIALNRVKTLARTISLIERLDRTGTSFTWPRATRSATSADVSPPRRTACPGPHAWAPGVLAFESAPAPAAVPASAAASGAGLPGSAVSSAGCVMAPTLRA